MKLRHNIFVSSTFQDMHFERDALHHIVIPELISRFSKKHVNVDLIDLRWGIDTSGVESEQENTVKILKVCFDEIERSKPFFIGFIGERYGWIPKSNDVESAILGYDCDDINKEISITEMEMLYALKKFDSMENCLFFIRNGLNPLDIEDENTRKIYFPENDIIKNHCDRVKKYLKDNCSSTTFDYNCYWDKESNSIKGLDNLCELIIEKLSELIEKELGYLFDENVSILKEESLLQASIIDDINENTFGREKEINELISFANSSEENELFVSATSGLGKSSLLASFCKKYESEALVIPFFAGVSNNSSDFKFLARYLYSALTQSDDDSILDIPYSELKKRLLGAIFDTSKEHKIVIVIDALDQFEASKELSELDFINEQLLPKNVKIIYSGLPEFEESLIKRNAKIYCLNSLSTNDIKSVANGIASKLHKDLSQTVLDLLVNKMDENGNIVCKTPIYLVLLLELLCSFDSDDFAKINKNQINENLTPALAIQKYLEETIKEAGAQTKDILGAISEKTILELGEKYNVITSLITSSSYGISEEEIIGISALTDTPISATDISLYRRMFRMHLTQQKNEKWIFNHAIIRNSMIEYALSLDNTRLFETCAKYYISLPNDNKEKNAGIIRYLGKLRRYKDIIPYACCKNKEAIIELISLIVDVGVLPILDACDEKQAFELCSHILSNLNGAAITSSSEKLKIVVSAIKKMQSLSFKKDEYLTILSNYYFDCGKLLIETGDGRGREFFEISTNVLKKASPRQLISVSSQAMRISDIFLDLEDWRVSESYAYLAYKIAKRHINDSSTEEEKNVFANACYKLYSCIQKNPLSMKKNKRSKYLALAYELGKNLDNYDLCVRCAIAYITLPVILRKRALTKELKQVIKNVDKDRLSAETYIEKELYIATYEDAVVHSLQAYESAVFALAQNNDKDAMILYERAIEEYLYRLMIDKNTSYEHILDIYKRTDNILKKLTLVTNDIIFTDKRLGICNDFEHFSKSLNKKELLEEKRNEILHRINKERKSKNTGHKRKKEVYKSLALKLGFAGFLLYAIVQFAGFTFSHYELYLLEQLFDLFTNMSETFTNITLSVVLFFALLLIYSLEKRSYNYELDSKAFIKLSIACSVLYLVSTAFPIISLGWEYNPVMYEYLFWETVISHFRSVVFAGSILWFIVYIFALVINNPFKTSVQAEVKYKYRFKELIIRHIKLISISAIPFITFIPLAFNQAKYSGTLYIDMLGTTSNTYLKFCYIPLILQLIYSCVELFVMAKNYGKPNCNSMVKVKVVNKKVLVKGAIIVACTVILVLSTSYTVKQVSKELMFEEYGYSMSKGFSYNLVDEGAMILKYHGDDDDVVVPSKLEGHKVYGISNNAFKEKNIVSITISEGITTIESSSFLDCKKLKEVNLPLSIVRIGWSAFSGCESLEIINIPEGIKEIDSYVFSNCKKLTDICLPSSVVTIGSGAFSGCESLTSITTNNTGYIEISSSAFDDCGITTSEQVKQKGFYMIGNNIAWVDKENLVGKVQIPKGVTVIDEGKFAGAKNITELYLPDTLVTISSRAFSNNTSLYYVYLPSTITSIEVDAFVGCTSLMSIDNNSSLELSPGSTDHGGIAYYAKIISKNNDALIEKEK